MRSLSIGVRLLLGVGVAAIVGALAWSHQTSTQPHDERSIVIADGDTVQLIMPDTVRAGHPFEVTYASFGGGCVREPARAGVMISERTAVVQSYDHHDGGFSCPADQLRLPHRAWLRFDSPGIASVRIAGGRRRGTERRAATVELARNVVVCMCRPVDVIRQNANPTRSTFNAARLTRPATARGIAFTIDTTTFDGNALPPGPDALREWAAFATFKAAVTFAEGRGRMDITWVRSGPSTVVDGAAATLPAANVGDYYLFDSTGYVLVRPGSRTFTSHVVTDDVFDLRGDRDGWPQYFQFVPPRIDTVGLDGSPAQRGEVHLYWHADALPMIALARGRLTLIDVPLGELNVARWFGASRALLQLSDLPSTRTTITTAVPTVPIRMTGALPSILLKQELTKLRATDVDLSTLMLPGAFRDTGPMSDGRDVGRHWRARPHQD